MKKQNKNHSQQTKESLGCVVDNQLIGSPDSCSLVGLPADTFNKRIYSKRQDVDLDKMGGDIYKK